jgi:hypothetical protein
VAAAAAAARHASATRARGIACLFGNCGCMALFLTAQQALLARYPAPMRVTLLSYAFGTAMLLVALLASGGAGEESVADAAARIARGEAALGRWQLPAHARGAVVYAGVVASGLNYVLLAWGNQQARPFRDTIHAHAHAHARANEGHKLTFSHPSLSLPVPPSCLPQLGPATVSLYLPLQPLAAALLSRAFLGTPVGSAALAGGAAILTGLAAVATGRAAARRAEERAEEKAAYLRSLEAGGGGAAGGARMVRSASAKLLREPDYDFLENRPDWGS